MKRFACGVFLAIVMSFCVFAAPIYKYEVTEPITETVSLTKVEEFHSDHNISYSYIKMDLTDDRVKLELLKSQEGTDIMDGVKNLASSNKNTLAAINADFFSSFSGNKGFSLGIEKKDGEVLQSPINPDTMATVAVGENEVLMTYLDFHVMVVAPDWEYNEIRHINKHTTYYGDILMYTSSFNGGYSPAPGGDVVEVVVEENKIVEFRRGMEPCLIPENGCVLVVSEGSSMFFENHFSLGDEVKFDWYITPSLDSFDMAFGGGSMLVKDGQDVGKIGDYTHTVAGFHPRSAIGIDKDGKTLYLVAVDGRQTSSRGMRMSHLAELLIELGCYNAVNLDGGGSTNLVASTLWNNEIHTVNNPTENRRVINAVGIVMNVPEEDAFDDFDEEDSEDRKTSITDNDEAEPYGIKIRSNRDAVYKGQEILFEAVVYDENIRPIVVDETEFDWYCSDGEIDNGVFVSAKGGEITVGVSYGDCYAETTVFVVDEICGIVTENVMNLKKGESEKIDVSVFDAYGHFVNVTDCHDFEIISSDDNVVSIVSDTVKAVNDGLATVTVSNGSVSTYISIAVGEKQIEYKYGFENEKGYFTSYPNETKGDFELSQQYVFSGLRSGALSYDFSEETVVSEENSELELLEVSKAVYFALGENVAVSGQCDLIGIQAFSEDSFGHEIRLQITDGDGNSQYLKLDRDIVPGEWNSLEFEIPKEIKRPVKLSHVYILFTPGEEKDSGCVYFDDLRFATVSSYDTATEEQNTYIHSFNNANVSSNIRITALSDEGVNNPVSVFYRNNAEAMTLSDNGFVVDEKTKTSFTEDDNALYMFIDASGGGIRNSSASQWNEIVTAVNSTEKDNIILVVNNAVFGSDEFENRVICDYLASLQKNVFVVERGSSAAYMNISGVKYITLDSYPENNFVFSGKKRINSVVFRFGEIVTFEFESI